MVVVARNILILSLAGILFSACAGRPATAPDSRLVAAGILKGDMTTRSGVVNDLRIVKIATGQMTISFSGYRLPPRSVPTTYVVKAVPGQLRGMVVPVVTIESCTAEGIVLRVADPDGKMLLPLKYLAEHEFTIEVHEVPPK